MSPSLLRPSQVVSMVIEGEEVHASRICSSSSTLKAGLEGRLIDLWWQAMAFAGALLSVLWLKRWEAELANAGLNVSGLQLGPIYTEEACEWLHVDGGQIEFFISFSRCCLLCFETWQQHVDSVMWLICSSCFLILAAILPMWSHCHVPATGGKNKLVSSLTCWIMI